MNLSPIRATRLSMRPARSTRVRPGLEPLEDRRLLSVILHESEPNNSMQQADPIDRRLDEMLLVPGEVGALGDRDWFAIPLHQGDVIGVAVNGKSRLDTTLRLVDAQGDLVIANDDSFKVPGRWLPPESPLPRNNSKDTDSEIYTVIAEAGTYFLEVAASGDGSTGRYDLELVVARPGLERQPVGTRQILFLDFDGARVNFSRYLDTIGGIRDFSPLAEALPSWGLSMADEDAVIDAILAEVTEKLSTFVREQGPNGDFASTGIAGQFDIEIRNSRDHADEFGTNPLVSRIVVGLINDPKYTAVTTGEAQFIDVGNFKTDDEAVATIDWFAGAITQFPIAPPATVIDAAAAGIGYTIAHEAGHLFGCWHTDQARDDLFAGTYSLMDPASLPLLGPDLVFGTPDDIDMQFARDAYHRGDYFLGINDTLSTVAFGLSTGKGSDPTSQVESLSAAGDAEGDRHLAFAINPFASATAASLNNTINRPRTAEIPKRPHNRLNFDRSKLTGPNRSGSGAIWVSTIGRTRPFFRDRSGRESQ